MSKIEEKCEAMYNYLREIDSWEVYKAHDRGIMMYGYKSDNVVEQVFSWLKVNRYFSPYYFLKLMFLNVAERNSLMKDKVEKRTCPLNEYAEEVFQKVQDDAKHQQFKVVVTDKVRGYAVVYPLDKSRVFAEQFSVQVYQQKCSCGLWFQLGVPCIHAWFVMKYLNLQIHINELYSTKYFHTNSLTISLKEAFNKYPQLLLEIPSDALVTLIKDTNVCRRIIAPTYVDDITCVNNIRIRSTGEGGSKGTSMRKHKQTKIRCAKCNALLSVKTLHPTSACLKNQEKNGAAASASTITSPAAAVTDPDTATATLIPGTFATAAPTITSPTAAVSTVVTNATANGDAASFATSFDATDLLISSAAQSSSGLAGAEASPVSGAVGPAAQSSSGLAGADPYACPDCGKPIAKKTKHPPSACLKYQNKQTATNDSSSSNTAGVAASPSSSLVPVAASPVYGPAGAEALPASGLAGAEALPVYGADDSVDEMSNIANSYMLSMQNDPRLTKKARR
jgi:hypothetical protein